jgi:hypothetical protein
MECRDFRLGPGREASIAIYVSMGFNMFGVTAKMQNPVIEILHLVADGIVRPEEGQVLLAALRAGYPEEFDRGAPVRRPARESSAIRGEPLSDRAGPDPPTPVPTSPASEGPPSVADPMPSPSPKGSDPSAGETQGAHLPPGEAVVIPSTVLLRIDATGVSRSADASLNSVAIRGAAGQRVRVVRGEGVKLHREGEGVWRLTWSGGMLFLEIPVRLAGLAVQGVSGSVGLSGYVGPFSGEEIGGGFTVHGASEPFRIREVRGDVRLHRLSLRDGISTIAAVSQNVEIETAQDASVTIRASLRPEIPEGAGNLDAGGDSDSDRGGRRGVWRVGAGTAQLNVSQVRGQLRLRPSDDAARDEP